MPKSFHVHGEITGYSIESVPATVGGFTLEGARVHNNWTIETTDPLSRITIQGVVVRRCQLWSMWPKGLLFRNVEVEDIRGAGVPVQLSACHFENVRLSGWIGGLLFKWQHGNNEIVNRAFVDDNLRRYSMIEQALDISKARWRTFDSLIGVPARLVKRDAKAQFILKRENARSLVNRDDVSAWRVAARDLLESGLPDTVVVPGESRAGLEAAERLLAAGLID